jgi:hypothetical protein
MKSHRKISSLEHHLYYQRNKDIILSNIRKQKMIGNWKQLETIKCLYCEEEFIPKSKINKWCCNECHYKYLRERYIKKTKHDIRKCKRCGKEFVSNNNNQLYCSKECNKLFFKNRYKQIQNGEINYSNGNVYTFLRIRFEILKRDNFQCQYCGRTPKKDKCKLVIDHIIPRNNGGLTEVNNLITSCEECNLGKTDILLEERQLNKIEKKNGNLSKN